MLHYLVFLGINIVNKNLCLVVSLDFMASYLIAWILGYWNFVADVHVDVWHNLILYISWKNTLILGVGEEGGCNEHDFICLICLWTNAEFLDALLSLIQGNC